MDLTPTREDVILLGMDAYERRCRAALAEATAAQEQAHAAFIGTLGSYLEAWKPHAFDVVTRAAARLGPVLEELDARRVVTPPAPDMTFTVCVGDTLRNGHAVFVEAPKPYTDAREPWAVVCGFPPDLWPQIFTGESTQYVIRFDIFIYVPVTISTVPTQEVAGLRLLVIERYADWLSACRMLRAAHAALTPEAIARCRADLETQFSAAVLSTLKVLQCPTP